MNGNTPFMWHRYDFSFRNEHFDPLQQPGCTRTRYDSYRDFFFLNRCHVNEYSATRGNRDDFAPERKVVVVSC